MGETVVQNRRKLFARIGWLGIGLATILLSASCNGSGNGSGSSVQTVTDNGVDVTEGFWSNRFGTQLFLASDGSWEHFRAQSDALLTRGSWTLDANQVTFAGTVVLDPTNEFDPGDAIACTGSVQPDPGLATIMSIACTSMAHLDTFLEDPNFDHET